MFKMHEDKVSDLQNQSPLSPKHSVLFSASLKTSQTKQDDYPTWELLSGSGTFQLTLYHLSNLRLKVLEVEGGQEAQGAQMECHDWRHATLRANELSAAPPATGGPSSQTQAAKLGGVGGSGTLLSPVHPTTTPSSPRESSAPPLNPQLMSAADRTGKEVFLGKLTASAPLALATALPPRLGSPRILGQNPSGTDRQLDEGTVGRGAQTHGTTRGPYAWPIDSGSSRLSLQT